MTPMTSAFAEVLSGFSGVCKFLVSSGRQPWIDSALLLPAPVSSARRNEGDLRHEGHADTQTRAHQLLLASRGEASDVTAAGRAGAQPHSLRCKTQSTNLSLRLSPSRERDSSLS